MKSCDLEIAHNKCVVMHIGPCSHNINYCLQNNLLPYKSEYKDLELYFTQYLKFRYSY